ncbi:hypothetical protein PENTCL1PPCAC_24197, partial [Pristionchus entomophagus]
QVRKRELHFTMNLANQTEYFELKNCNNSIVQPCNKMKRRNNREVDKYQRHVDVSKLHQDGAGAITNRAADLLSRFNMERLFFYSSAFSRNSSCCLCNHSKIY